MTAESTCMFLTLLSACLMVGHVQMPFASFVACGTPGSTTAVMGRTLPACVTVFSAAASQTYNGTIN